jgi:hypothetical protein
VSISGGILMKSDYPGELMFFSAIAGGIVSLIKLLVHHIFMWLKLAEPFYTTLNAYLIHGHFHIKGFIESIFAEMGDISIGAIFGILLGFWLAKSRLKYHWWIGLSYGFGIWFLTLSLGNLTKLIKPDETTPWSLFAHLLAMLTFGVLFVLATRFWEPLKSRLAIECDTSWKRK